MGHLIQVRHGLLHHGAKQILFPLVPLIQRPGGDAGSLADGFERRLFKAACKELRSGAVQDPGINGAVRHCHAIASLFNNSITDNLIINIAWRVEPVKGKLRKELFPFFRVSGMIALR